jgi:hypothetical protein
MHGICCCIIINQKQQIRCNISSQHALVPTSSNVIMPEFGKRNMCLDDRAFVEDSLIEEGNPTIATGFNIVAIHGIIVVDCHR